MNQLENSVAKEETVMSSNKPLLREPLKPRPILSDKSNANRHTKLKNIKHKPQDTLDSQQKAHIQEFFDDNQTRYQPEDTMVIVPVLPIAVPTRMKHLFIKDIKTTQKRAFEDNDDDEKRENKKTKFTSRPLFVPDAPPLEFTADQETIQYDSAQEKRAKLAMLQTTQSLCEGQWNDPMLVAEYAGEIFGHLYDIEPSMMGNPDYANHQQHEVTWGMRSVLIDWVIEIHYLFGLLPETLFLTVNIIDRFLSKRTVVLGKLQLVGITALFIAAKFEELTTPPLRDFLFMTDNAVNEDELIKAERFILQVLDFRLCYPNPLNFLRRVCTEEMQCDIHTRTLAKYFMEVACIDHSFIGTRPSLIAASALWLSKRMLAKGKWTPRFTKLSGYAPDDLKATVERMLDYLSQPVTHDAFFRKWSTKRCAKASIFVRDWINRFYINVQDA
ncbi:cyclin-like protein [Gilbertella persicaria]|uniref:G2/mitotic-specific cyclin n=1 Tax=Rhizopus stolonifer TaxID=4846 RepID=A0A367KUL6_RHIST|nr:cyclin-like protein [Gilbertella persicaria]KAI8066304.1 cyclin-like protein [Gilbertella persicaria]RCI05891.1 G2/mitotic-specific cyclin [Rhizopus stolonifer]